MRVTSLDQDAISPVMATILLTAIVVVMSTSAYVLVNVYREGINEPAPVVAFTNRDGGGLRLDSFDMKMVSSSPAQPLYNYLFVLTTPQNGTLVATPEGALGDTQDFYFQLGSSAGRGLHHDNGTVVGIESLGGFHIRVGDVDGDGLFGAGDTIDIWYDGDGDQAHQNGRDDDLPSGAYGFDVKHRPSESIVAMERRDF